jgi:LacI family transcriptional regulator
LSVTIEMIAERAQVSRGTVDRVIHNRGRVNPETAEKVRSIMAELNYQANPLGRAFSLSQQKITIGVMVAFKEPEFSNQIMAGVQDGISYAEQYGLKVLLQSVDDDDISSCKQALQFFQNEHVSGIALKGLTHPQIQGQLHSLREGGIRVVTFNSDMDSDCRDCFVGQDHDKGGQCAAYLMEQICHAQGELLVIGVSPGHQASSRRIDSFSQAILSHPECGLIPSPPLYCSGRNQLSFELTKQRLSQENRIRGVFVSGAGLSGASQAVYELGLAGTVKVIGFDTTQSNLHFLHSGAVQFLIDQNPYQQGYRPLRILADSLFLKEPIACDYYDTGIEIRSPFNLD